MMRKFWTGLALWVVWVAAGLFPFYMALVLQSCESLDKMPSMKVCWLQEIDGKLVRVCISKDGKEYILEGELKEEEK
jgi:hypothetical protein